MHATNKSTEDEFYRWLVGSVIWIAVVDITLDEGILCNFNGSNSFGSVIGIM